MHLSSLRLYQFKNHLDQKFTFGPELNAIIGENGSGKTNLLDAIYFLALSKSAFQKQDALNITHGHTQAVIEGAFVTDEHKELITIVLDTTAKKQVLLDKKPYERISEHIGKYPVVMIAPDDTDLIRDGSEYRRRVFDGIISQLDPVYLTNYQQYNRYLDQRNSLLKQFAEQRYFDQNLLDAYSIPLVDLAMALAERRRAFLADFLPMVRRHYLEISEGKEEITIAYESLVKEDFKAVFYAQQNHDRAAQRTSMGVHKDDFLLLMDGESFKKFGSQGQKKSMILAIKLAQFDILRQYSGKKPLLLLDDIFDKLDDQRMDKLVKKIVEGHFGQVFLTDARPERTKGLFKDWGEHVKIYEF